MPDTVVAYILAHREVPPEPGLLVMRADFGEETPPDLAQQIREVLEEARRVVDDVRYHARNARGYVREADWSRLGAVSDYIGQALDWFDQLVRAPTPEPVPAPAPTPSPAPYPTPPMPTPPTPGMPPGMPPGYPYPWPGQPPIGGRPAATASELPRGVSDLIANSVMALLGLVLWRRKRLQ